jgi:magnesium-protoporphyrin IX monomethyl ester (oxidative) cyclase
MAATELSLAKPISPMQKLNRPMLKFSTLIRLHNPSQFRVMATATANTSTTPKKKFSKTEIKETLLTPRFYTTDFDEMEQLFNMEINKNLNQDEFVALLNEFKTDYNQTHFVRNPEFKEAADKMQGPLRQIFVEFLERSCTAEFSGFLLYKELGRRLKVYFIPVATWILLEAPEMSIIAFLSIEANNSSYFCLVNCPKSD